MTLNHSPRSPQSPRMSSSPVCSPNESPPHIVSRCNDIIKPALDKREYRGLVLSNRLKVLLVSDSTTDKSAAAIDVNVGYLSDPDEVPGLAHFCEHMLFLGTEKYPQENEYSKFLNQNGGSCNASTSSDHTQYYFDVLPEKLPEALDIFAQFFISPLFTESATDRELNAVHSEHEKNMSSDSWRVDQLNKSTADPKHPYHKFGTGSRETLETIPKSKGINVREELLKFHQTWYSSNIMTLIVLGKESLDELEDIVVPLFSQIKDKSVVASTWPESPYPPELRQRKAYCYPIKDLRSLSIDFPVHDSRKHYKSSPSHYLSHLLGHESAGSLLSALKDKGWCNRLSCGARYGARGFGFFNVNVDLTEEGIGRVDDIVLMVFQYIAMLRKEGPLRWIWEEQKDLMAMDFKFKDVQEPWTFVSTFVHYLQEYPVEDILSAYYIMTDWKPELIQEILDKLTPENVRIAVEAKSFEAKCTQVEKWYGTKYFEERISDELIKKWNSAPLNPDLYLPEPNDFIPSRLDVLPEDGQCTFPVIIKDTPLMRLWHGQDSSFGMPKAHLCADFFSPLAYAEPAAISHNSIYILLLRDSLQQFAYSAELAGLQWGISVFRNGIKITIDGYDDKQHVLLDKIIDVMINFKTEESRFNIMKENHIRSIKNFEAEQPYQQAMYEQALCLTDCVWTREQILEAALDVTADDIDDYVRRFLRKFHVEAFIYGNIDKQRALVIAENFENKLPKDGRPLLPQQMLLSRELELEKGTSYIKQIENSVHKSSCSMIYYQCGERNSKFNVILEMIAQLISEPCFYVLRTTEQLGYIVFSGLRRSNGVQGLRVLVQSDRHPAYLDSRIEKFLNYSEKYLTEMSDEEFEKHRAALIAQKLEKPKRLSLKAAQFWVEVGIQMYNFDRRRLEVEDLRLIRREEVMDFFKQYFSVKSSDRKKLSIYIVSTADGGAGVKDAEPAAEKEEDELDLVEPTIITDLIEFKSRRKLYSLPEPFLNIPRKGTQCKL